jgi:hypothetical protein
MPLMNALLIADADSATTLSSDLIDRLQELCARKGYTPEVVQLRGEDAAPCRGCLLCLTRHPGRCVTMDAVCRIMQRMHVERDGCITVFFTPVRFGHPSSIVKNALDRGTGSRWLQVIIGYGDDIDPEEESTFVDITAKHCGAADIVHPGMVREAMAFVARSPKDNAAICAAIEERL